MSGGCGSFDFRICTAVASTTATPARSSPPRPVVGSALLITLPATTGFAPRQTGTVSMWAISSRRGPGSVPGSCTIRLPVLPFTGVLVCAESKAIAPAGQPASRSHFTIRSAIAFSSPDTPGIASRSRTIARAVARSAGGTAAGGEAGRCGFAAGRRTLAAVDEEAAFERAETRGMRCFQETGWRGGRGDPQNVAVYAPSRPGSTPLQAGPQGRDA